MEGVTIRAHRLSVLILLLLISILEPASGEILVPMDRTQADHLRAYGLAYWSLQQGWDVEWLLNYRHGSFLLKDREALGEKARLLGVTTEKISQTEIHKIRRVIEEGNMETVLLEVAPHVAVYTPPNTSPWDDAVTLALTYAQIPFTTLWDEEVLGGRLTEFDWLHLHHEDFTGQFSKFFINYRGADWFRQEVAINREMADRLGYPKVAVLKAEIAMMIDRYVRDGGFLFAMCAATETFEIALAARGIDIVPVEADGDPPDPLAQEMLSFDRSFAFRDIRLELKPFVNAFSNIDGHRVNTPNRASLETFHLFPFSAKFDPVASMLTQCHEEIIDDFYGLTTSFRREVLKDAVIVLAEEVGKPWVKYIHGNIGKGTFTYLGGHDPEDPQHAIGDPPTRLEIHRNSPGYRLILNNILFPGAKKIKRKT
jgi:hypothetical protein